MLGGSVHLLLSVTVLHPYTHYVAGQVGLNRPRVKDRSLPDRCTLYSGEHTASYKGYSIQKTDKATDDNVTEETKKVKPCLEL